jgi:hypothetical protein
MAHFIERDTSVLEGLGSAFSNIQRARYQRCSIAFLGDSVPFSATHAPYTRPHHSSWKVETKIGRTIHTSVHLRLTLILLMWRIWWAPNSSPIYIQQDTTLHSLLISGNCSTCFGWYFHPSSGADTTVSTASGICHNVTAICRYRGRVGTGMSVLWVAGPTTTNSTATTMFQR